MKKNKRIMIVYSIAFVLVIAMALFAFITKDSQDMPAQAVIAEERQEPAIAIMPENNPGRKATPKADYPNVPICPPELAIEYYIDDKGTALAIDDEAFIGIQNNKPQAESITIAIENNYEGAMELKSLGASIIKSKTITSWWNSLSRTTNRTFTVDITSEKCQTANSQLDVSYPPKEEDYND